MSERINIKDITLEEPEKKKGLPFDVEKEITEEDWGQVKEAYEQDKIYNAWVDGSSLAMATKVLFPERMAELTGYNDFKERLEDELVWLRGLPDWHEFLWAAMKIKILFPTTELGGVLGNITWQDLKDEIKEAWSSNDPLFYSLAMKIKIVFPERFSSELDMNETTWMVAEKWLEYYYMEHDWIKYVTQGMIMKVLFPEKASTLSPDKTAWQGMKEQLTGYRARKEWPQFFLHAMRMKTLVAEEVKITDKGLEIIMQKEEAEFKEETPPMPQRRKF